MSTGLTQRYYTGGYYNDDLNWYDNQSYTETTVTATINENISGQGIGDNKSFRWHGYITPKTSGTWEFYTNSDDSSRLYIAPLGTMFTNAVPNTGLNTIRDDSTYFIVNNSGTHGGQDRYGSISLNANTIYEIILYFGEAGGGEQCHFGWKPPGVGTSQNHSTFYKNMSDSTSENYE